MVPAVTPLRSPSTAPSCARIDSRPDTAKIGSADRVEVHHARLLAAIGVRKTFPHGLGHQRTLGRVRDRSVHPSTTDMWKPHRHGRWGDPAPWGALNISSRSTVGCL